MTLISCAAAVACMASVAAQAHGDDSGAWDRWVQAASAGNPGQGHGEGVRPGQAMALIPAGSASYSGSTVAMVSDSASGSTVNSVSTGTLRLNVSFSGTGTTTETGSITGLSGTAGAAIGDLAFTGSGTGSRFSGTLTSTKYTAVAATSTTPATGTGAIRGELSAPVLVTPAVAATATTAAVPAVYAAPLAAAGHWGFVATTTLKANGAFIAVKQ